MLLRGSPSGLHSVRKLDAKDAHCLSEHAGKGVYEHQPCLEHFLVALPEHRGVVVILVELLCQLIGVVGNDGGREVRRGVLYLLRITVEQLYEADFLGARLERRAYSALKALFRSLAQDGLDAGVGILDERSTLSMKYLRAPRPIIL